MRRLLTGVLAVLGLAAWLSAKAPLRPPVSVPAVGLSARLEDGRVVTGWRRYKREDFSYYILVKSTSSAADPVYPGDTVVFSTNEAGEIRYVEGRPAPGMWRYRLFVETKFGDLWASSAVSVPVDAAELQHSPPTAADFEWAQSPD